MMLAGFEAPTAGRIFLDGSEISRLPPHGRGIGVVFQNYALFPHMTVAENIGFPLSVRGVAGAEIAERAEKALKMVRLSGLGERRPSQLSGGQQQRVALARAMVFEPKLILLDEPLGALDKQLRERMQFELKQMHQELGVTMIYVTHDQSEALTMSDRIAVFNDGAVQQLSSPEDLYEHPRNAFVAQFIGENNQLCGTVLEFDSATCQVRLEDGTVVMAQNIEINQKGQKALISVRPERIKLVRHGEAVGNLLRARVEGKVYLGDAVRIVLQTHDGQEVIAKLPVDNPACASGVGDVVGLGWEQEYCRAFFLQ
jgi:putative spermidine/putrescine transport system ATP-binding protein